MYIEGKLRGKEEGVTKEEKKEEKKEEEEKRRKESACFGSCLLPSFLPSFLYDSIQTISSLSKPLIIPFIYRLSHLIYPLPLPPTHSLHTVLLNPMKRDRLLYIFHA